MTHASVTGLMSSMKACIGAADQHSGLILNLVDLFQDGSHDSPKFLHCLSTLFCMKLRQSVHSNRTLTKLQTLCSMISSSAHQLHTAVSHRLTDRAVLGRVALVPLVFFEE